MRYFVHVFLLIVVFAAKAQTYSLPEVVVNSKDKEVLHILALVREYSTLSSYNDTTFLFRERWVDFMLPTSRAKRYSGWSHQRTLSSRSYYHFTDCANLDSVSDRYFGQHFSWAEWISAPRPTVLPVTFRDNELQTADTLRRGNLAAEIWKRSAGMISVQANVLSSRKERKWASGYASFLNSDEVSFEKFKVLYNFNNTGQTDSLRPEDLKSMVYQIESIGRGTNMLRTKNNKPCFITTVAEVYFVDREFISRKEARKWEKIKLEDLDLRSEFFPDIIPPVSAEIAELKQRVEEIDHTSLRIRIKPDQRLAGRDLRPVSFKERALKYLKSLIGL